MPRDPIIIEAEIILIREHIASGVLEVETTSGGVHKKVKYPGIDDLKKRLEMLEAELVAIVPRRRGVLAAF